ncbi:MAG: integrin alpha, partial [Actinobacteria bacterium]|nr:integrin alpha [Actinomycetota bacterium]
MVVAAVGCGALTLGATSSFAATPDTPYQLIWVDSLSPDPSDHFADRLTAGDATGDGVQDIFAATLGETVNGVAGAGRVQLINGKTRQIEYSIINPDFNEPETGIVQFGFYISVPGDVDGDGAEDVTVGTNSTDVYSGAGTACGKPEPNGCNENQGRAYVFSGRTGQLIRRLNNPHPQAQGNFGSRLGAAGDVNRDGRPDILAGAPFNDVRAGTFTSDGCANLAPVPADCRRNQGQAFVFSGATGDLLREYNIPIADQTEASCNTTFIVNPPVDPLNTRACGNFGYTQQVLGDMTGDGVPEHSIGAGQYKPDLTRHGRYYIFNGATGAVLSRIDQPVPDPSAYFGLNDPDRFAPGDVTGDGVPDIYGTGFQQDSPDGGPDGGRAWIFDGAASIAAGTGVLRYEMLDPNPEGASFGWSMSASDYNKDGTNDIYLGGLQGTNSETYIYNGRDGSLIRTLGLGNEFQPNVPGNSGSGLGYSSRAPGDLNGDCEQDYVASAQSQDVGANQDQGRVAFFLSAGPSACSAASPTPTGAAPGGGGSISTPGTSGAQLTPTPGASTGPGVAAQALRARAFRSCLVRAARHTRLDLAATRRGSLRARALARRHLR